MLPFSLISSKSVEDLYFLEPAGKLQLIRDGDVGPVMIGHEYVIFSDILVEVLKTLDLEGTRFEPAIIWNRKTDIEYIGYQRAIISSHFSDDQINDVNLDGLKFLKMNNQYLFASPELHNKIVSSDISTCFVTSEGLSHFG